MLRLFRRYKRGLCTSLLLMAGLIPGLLQAQVQTQVQAQPPAQPQPQRVVSLNLCADQYLLLLADRSQIAALSHLATDPQQSYYARRAAGLPNHRGQADFLASLQPDLILSHPFSNRTASSLLSRLGYRVEQLQHPTSLAQVLTQIRQLGQWLGQSQRADQVIAQMQQRMADQARRVPPLSADSPSLLQYSAGGFTVGEQTLTGELIRRAGWYNKARDAQISHYGKLDLEQLLQLAPDRLLDGTADRQHWSAAQQLLQHPALQRSEKPGGWIYLPQPLWNCGGPMLLDAIDQLILEREQLDTYQ